MGGDGFFTLQTVRRHHTLNLISFVFYDPFSQTSKMIIYQPRRNGQEKRNVLNKAVLNTHNSQIISSSLKNNISDF